jgi:hypothetical protein
MRRRSRNRLAVAAVACVLLGACAGGATGSDGPMDAEEAARDLPDGEMEPEGYAREADELEASADLDRCRFAVFDAVARMIDSGNSQAVSDSIARELGMQSPEWAIYRELYGETSNMAYRQGNEAAAAHLAARADELCRRVYP